MRGVNLGGWFSQIDSVFANDPPTGARDDHAHMATFLGANDFARIKSWGFDHVRLPVDYANIFTGPELRPEETALGVLDRAIDGLIAAGLKVIFDLHKCPGHDFHQGGTQVQSFFTDPAQRVAAMQIWTHLAERYGSRREIMLEILNEPVAEDSRVWDKIKNDFAAHVRHYAPNATLVIGSNRWNHAHELTNLTPFDDANVLYSFHYYASLLFTHQHAPWVASIYDVLNTSRPYPGDYIIPANTEARHPLDPGRWDRTHMQQHLEPVFRFREKYDVAVACNEFGVYVGGADRDSQLRWTHDFLSILTAHGIGWSYWNYKNLDFGLVSDGEQRFADYPRYANPERVDRELVQVLRSY